MANTSLPPDLFTTFKQYKIDTEYVAGWLATTAEKCGFVRNTSNHTEKAPKLKGRARKLTRDAAKAERAENSTPKYFIEVQEFLPMAEYLAIHSPKVFVPQEMPRVVERVIDARMRCNDWFIQNSHREIPKNQSHAHFTKVLTSTWEILRPCWSKWEKKKAGCPVRDQSRKNAGVAGTAKNIFNVLDLEDVVNDDESTMPGNIAFTVPTNPSGPRATIQLDDSDLEEEFMFAIHAFMDDLQKIREYLFLIWRSYHSGNTDLVVASLVTNTAIDIVREAEQSFETLLTRPKAYPLKVYPTGVLPAILYHQHVQDDDRRLDTGYSVNLETIIDPPQSGHRLCECHSKDFCFYPVYIALKIYCRAVDKVWDRDKKPNGYGVPYGLDSANQRYGRRQVIAGVVDEEAANATQETMTRLWKYLPDLQASVCSFKSLFAQDEIMSGVRHMMYKRNIPIWAIFGAQTFADIQDELQDCTMNALEDVRVALDRAQRSFEKHHEFAQGASYASRDSLYDDSLRESLRDIRKWVFEDELGNVKHEDIHFDEPGRHHSEPDMLLSAHPLRCGLLKYDLYLQLHAHGIDLINYTSDVVMMCHVYVAARLADKDMRKWPDLELFMATHEPERLFIGGLPTSFDQCFKKFSIACGSSAISFARNRRNDRHIFRRENARISQSVSAISDILYERISGCIKDREASFRKLQSLLQDSKYGEHIKQQLGDTSKLKAHGLSWTQQRMPPKRLPPLLSQLETALNAEMPELCFDYFSLHRTCSRIFDEICSSLFLDYGGSNFWLTGRPIMCTMSLLEYASTGEQLQSNKFVMGHLLHHTESGIARSPLRNVQSRANAKLDSSIANDSDGVCSRKGAIKKAMMNATSLPLQQVSSIIQAMYVRQETDVEVQKLHTIADGTEYGWHIFSEISLRSFYSTTALGKGRSAPWTDFLYNANKRHGGKCRFREHSKTASQRRIDKRICRTVGLDFMAMVLEGVAELSGEEVGRPQAATERLKAFVRANIQKLVKVDRVTEIGRMFAGLDGIDLSTALRKEEDAEHRIKELEDDAEQSTTSGSVK